MSRDEFRDNRHVRVVVQRVQRAAVKVDGAVVAACDTGLLVLLGIAADDTEAQTDRMAARVARLRVFENDGGKLDLAVTDVGGEVLVVSQFTLIADTRKGNRPSFAGAARPEVAEPLYARFCRALRADGLRVATGRFGARMEIELVNDGPVTIVLE
jgi:D-tyrosyl-tRNA(Tyr) deacylase